MAGQGRRGGLYFDSPTAPAARRAQSTEMNITETAGLTTEILVIDDDRLIREMLSFYLKGRGHAVVACDGGEAGIAQCRQRLPSAVLCDLRMPRMDGLAVLETLHREFPELPVIVVSGTGDVADAIGALKLGAADFITKPIEDFAVLDHALDRSLERARLQAENRAYRATLEAANARLAESLAQLEADEAAGRKIQFALLPQREVRFGDFECSHHLATSAILSGDFVDYFAIDEGHFGFYMADVSGHGVSSAVITVLLKCYVTRYLENYRRYEDPTICQPAGLLGSARYARQSLPVAAGFALRLFSDGGLELLPDSALESKKAALSRLAADTGRNAQQLAEALGLTGRQDLPDDVSVLSLRRINDQA